MERHVPRARHLARRLLRAAAVLALPWAAGVVQAQAPGGVGMGDDLTVGSEVDAYLRTLQRIDRVPDYPWSVRSFSPRERQRLLSVDPAHPWQSRFAAPADSGRLPSLRLLRAEARMVYNTAFAFGANDGAVWAGRGLTTALQAGATARWKSLSIRLEPIVFWTQNRSFEMVSNGLGGDEAYADGSNSAYIDLPQRFGNGGYARLDPGQSTLRLDAFGIGVGVSTANRQWGPARQYPLLLGNNAPGFPHAFVETSTPADLRIARVQAQILWGQLRQSRYSTVPAQGDSATRFGTGLALAIQPGGVPGLEIGAARFFHLPWPDDVLDSGYLTQPFEGLLKKNIRNEQIQDSLGVIGVGNQIASVFARWVLPRSGVELYGEYAKEDHNYDFRDLLLEPDHDRAYLLGFQKSWARPGDRIVTAWAEVVNAQPSHLANVRNPTTFYVHSQTRQGHTQRGQVLGSPAVYGGGGSTVAVDVLDPAGRWTLAWERELRQERRDYLDPVTGVVDPDRPMQEDAVDLLHSLRLERFFFRGRFDVTAGVQAVYDFNRNFGDDAFNLNARLGVRGSL